MQNMIHFAYRLKDGGVICGLCCRFCCGNEELASYNFCHWASIPWRWNWQDQSLLPEACQEAVRLKNCHQETKKKGSWLVLFKYCTLDLILHLSSHINCWCCWEDFLKPSMVILLGLKLEKWPLLLILLLGNDSVSRFLSFFNFSKNFFPSPF